MKFRVMIEPDEDGIFVVECPSLPGCISQGRTRAEALDNIRDAISGYLASLEKHHEPVPYPIKTGSVPHFLDPAILSGTRMDLLDVS